MKKNIFQKGFTLVELLVVITIIVILATLLLLQLNVARSKGRDTKRVSDVTQIRTALEEYYDENGSYPSDASDTSLGKFMQSGKVPKDPSDGKAYVYAVNGLKYQVAAELENKNANALGSDADIDASSWSGGVNGGSENCTSAPGDCVFDLGVQ